MDKYIKLGKTYDSDLTEPASKDDSKVYYPTLYIDGATKMDCPDGKFEAKVILKKRSFTERTDKDGETTYSAEFDVHAIALPYKEEKKYEDPIQAFDEGAKEMMASKMIVIETE
jgi:hypothetical protein